MRRAIQELVDKGLLVRNRGVGTQVVHGQVKRPVELTSLFDDLRPVRAAAGHRGAGARDGRRPTGRWPSGSGLPVGAEVLHLERLRYAAASRWP